jgi:uncharacterized protein (TIGR00369 family)
VDGHVGTDLMPTHEDEDRTWLEWVNSHAMYRATQLICTSMTHDEAEFDMPASNLPLNPNGAVNGGVIAMAVDQALGALGMRVVPTGRLPMTTALNVVYHAPARPPLLLRSTVLNAGRAVLAIKVEVRGADDRNCCDAVGTLSVGSLDRRSASL